VIVLGHVEVFDDHRGDGVVRGADGMAFSFHCVAIADGSRHIDVGAAVRARRCVGLLGRDEVTDIDEVGEGS
jgi:hypothetical protein